ncbi:MAG: penicillin-binding protein 2 [Pseudomonadota bacterium]|nr:penicillin-binding protein 2 [Pseudomonadota bacterium]
MPDNPQPRWRLMLVFTAIAGLCGVLSWKVVDLQVLNNDAAQRQGDARTVRNDVIVATRGNIVDRNGEPLAISTPVQTLWLNPKEVLQHPEQGAALAEAMASIGVDPAQMNQRIAANASREFLYVKRRMPPADAQAVLDLGLKGLYALEEYQRFYPMGEAAVHLVGLTNADDVGQEGMELAYDEWLRGINGSKQVLKDRLGRIIREVQVDKVAQPGKDLTLSIDSRIQYIAYKALKEAVTTRGASAGTATVLDVRTGEVLAVVNQPSYNPNNRASLREGDLPNRAITSLLEPGSTVKTFTVTAALESGLFDTDTIIDTTPGYFPVARGWAVRDPSNYGPSNMARIIAKSSQVGAAKIGLTLGQGPMLDILQRVGFGQSLGTGFPGEESGVLPNRSRWAKTEIATMAYGYGFQVTPLQLAAAYSIYANNGYKKPVSLLKTDGAVEGERVIAADIVAKVNQMLLGPVSREMGGTGTRAAIPSYQVAGKTGTAWYYTPGKGYGDGKDRSYNSYFAGFVPASRPRVVIVVSIHQPKGDEYGGGAVAAPIFAEIASGTMRILNVPPDAPVADAQQVSLIGGPR